MNDLRAAMRDATAADHEALDRRVAALDLADRTDFGRFLVMHAAVLPMLESQLEAAGLGSLAPGWSAHRRTGALAADMADLGLVTPAPIAVDLEDSPAAVIGAAYVLEGSRLGGRMLAKQTGADLPAKFLAPTAQNAPFPAVVAAMERLLYTDCLIDKGIEAARKVFAAYGKSAGAVGLHE